MANRLMSRDLGQPQKGQYLVRKVAQLGRLVQAGHLLDVSQNVSAAHPKLDIVGSKTELHSVERASPDFLDTTEPTQQICPTIGVIVFHTRTLTHISKDALKYLKALEHTHYWRWKTILGERFGEACRIVAIAKRGRVVEAPMVLNPPRPKNMGSIAVEFADGFKVVTSRYAVRRIVA